MTGVVATDVLTYTAEKAERLIVAGKCPSNITVNGSLDLRDTAITALPDGLTVGGCLYLSDTAITALPDDLTVGGCLYLSDTAITALPDDLTVGGCLYLSGTAITALPDGLTVGGSLDLRGTAITALPDGLTVGGSLDLRDTAISLPCPWYAKVGEATRYRVIADDGAYPLIQSYSGKFTAGCRGPWTLKQALAHWASRNGERAKLFAAALNEFGDAA